MNRRPLLLLVTFFATVAFAPRPVAGTCGAPCNSNPFNAFTCGTGCCSYGTTYCQSGTDCGSCLDLSPTAYRGNCFPTTASCSCGSSVTACCAIDFTTTSNCGGCGQTCSGGDTCCYLNNQANPPYCANLQIDPLNCGNCGSNCGTINSICCSGGCHNFTYFQNSINNCGSCGTVCNSGQTPACCNTTCTDLSSNATHCGSCGNSCGGSTPICCHGSCRSTASFQTDNNNCGICGNVCGAGTACCGGTCVNDPNFNVQHCGSSCNPCIAPNNTCANGICYRVNCTAGFAACDPPICSNLQTDPQFCGNCETECAAGDVCCNGKCANLNSDSNNCGTCGYQCDPAIGDFCSNGVCGCNAIDMHCADGMKCCNQQCTFYDFNTGNCPPLSFSPCEWDRTTVCARCLPNQADLYCSNPKTPVCQIQMNSYADILTQIGMINDYAAIGAPLVMNQTIACNLAPVNPSNISPLYRCCLQNENSQCYLRAFTDLTANLTLNQIYNGCANSIQTVLTADESGTGPIFVPQFTLFPPIEQLCTTSYNPGSRFCLADESAFLGTRDCVATCRVNNSVVNGANCSSWYGFEMDQWRPDALLQSPTTFPGYTCSLTQQSTVLFCDQLTNSICGPYSTPATVASCQMQHCIFIPPSGLSCLPVPATCTCPGVTPNNGFPCGNPAFQLDSAFLNTAICGAYARGSVNYNYFVNGIEHFVATHDPLDPNPDNSCICLPGAQPAPPFVSTLPCSALPRPCTATESQTCGPYRIGCLFFPDSNVYGCICHDGTKYHDSCFYPPVSPPNALPWGQRSCSGTAELSKCGDVGFVSSCMVVCNPDVRQEQPIQTQNGLELYYPLLSPTNCTLVLGSCACAAQATQSVNATTGQTICHNPIQYRSCTTAEYTNNNCNLAFSVCTMQCNSTGLMCTVTTTNCYSPISNTIGCEVVALGSSIKFCGFGVTSCTVTATSLDNGNTWTLPFDYINHVVCGCAPPNNLLPVEYNYYRPCVTLLDIAYLCSPSDTIQFCGIPTGTNGLTPTELEYSTWLRDAPTRNCMRTSNGPLPGTCPDQWVIRPCTTSEFYVECTLPTDITCAMRCPASNTSSTACFRIGQCLSASPCNSSDILQFCSAATRSCQKYTAPTMDGPVVQLVQGSCRCVEGYDGEHCELALMPTRACTAIESLGFCGPAIHVLDCTTDLHGQIGTCDCNSGFGAGLLPCSNHFVTCTNNDRLAYLGVFGLSCTLLCNDNETLCTVSAFQCFANGYASGNFPCGTDRVFQHMTPTQLGLYCGHAVDGFMLNITLFNGTFQLIPQPSTCVCALNFFNDISGVCDLTFPIQPCNPTEFSNYCSATIPCYRKCHVPAPMQPLVCDQYFDNSCFNLTTYFGVAPPSSEIVNACGAFYQVGSPITATCQQFTNGEGYFNCLVNTFVCFCSASSPPQFQQPGFPACYFNYGFFWCDTDLPVVPYLLNLTAIDNWNTYCQQFNGNGQFYLFNPQTLGCSAVSNPSSLYQSCSPSPNLNAVAAAEAICYNQRGLTFMNPSTSQVCVNSPIIACGIQAIPWTNGTAAMFQQTCAKGQTFDFVTAACTTNPTGSTQATQFCGANAQTCVKRCFDLAATNCVLQACDCLPGFGVPTNPLICRYQYEADTCLDTPVPGRAQTDACGVFGDIAVLRCIGVNQTLAHVEAMETSGACVPACQCRPGSGPTPTSPYQCGGLDQPCDGLDIQNFCPNGGLSCTKRCEYTPSQPNFPSYCVFNTGSCVYPLQSTVICPSDQAVLQCGDGVQSCLGHNTNQGFVVDQCTCTNTSVSGFDGLPCVEWVRYDFSDTNPSPNNTDPLSCFNECGPNVLQGPAYAYYDINPRGITYNCAKRRYLTLNSNVNAPVNQLFLELQTQGYVVWNGTGWQDNINKVKQTNAWVRAFYVGRVCDCYAPFPGGLAADPTSSTQLLETMVYSTYSGVETIIPGDFRRVSGCNFVYIAVPPATCAQNYQTCNNPNGPLVCCPLQTVCSGAVGSQACVPITCGGGLTLAANNGGTSSTCVNLAQAANCGVIGNNCAAVSGEPQSCTGMTVTSASTCEYSDCSSVGGADVPCTGFYAGQQCCNSNQICGFTAGGNTLNGICMTTTQNQCTEGPPNSPSEFIVNGFYCDGAGRVSACPAPENIPQDSGRQYNKACGKSGICCFEEACINEVCYDTIPVTSNGQFSPPDQLFGCGSGLSFCPSVGDNIAVNSAGRVPLGSTCYNLQTSNSNCGACGNICPTPTTCVSGICTNVCPTGTVFDQIGCCPVGVTCVGNFAFAGGYGAIIISDARNTYQLGLNDLDTGLLCSGRGQLASSTSWSYQFANAVPIMDWNNNFITVSGTIQMQLTSSTSCNCYPGWAGSYCQIQDCCTILPTDSFQGSSSCLNNGDTQCSHPFDENGGLPTAFWTGENIHVCETPPAPFGGPTCCEFGQFCNSTSLHLAGNQYCLNGGVMLWTARGTVCTCAPGYENVYGDGAGGKLPNPFLPPPIGFSSVVQDTSLQCTVSLDPSQFQSGSPPCDGNGVGQFGFDPNLGRLVEYCVCNPGFYGPNCLLEVDCAFLGCDPQNNFAQQCAVEVTTSCANSNTCSCPPGQTFYSSGCVDLICLGQCIDISCGAESISQNVFGSVVCINPFCAALQCATSVECQAGFTFNVLTHRCEVYTCPSGWVLDATDVLNIICKFPVCSAGSCGTGPTPCNTPVCQTLFDPNTNLCRTVECFDDPQFPRGTVCQTYDVGLGQCVTPPNNGYWSVNGAGIASSDEGDYTGLNTAYSLVPTTGCTIYQCVCPITEVSPALAPAFTTYSGKMICQNSGYNCNPCPSWFKPFYVNDVTPTFTQFQPAILEIGQPLGGTFQPCTCAAGTTLCGGVCCPNANCVNSQCAANCTETVTRAWQCINTVNGYWADDPNLPGICCDKWFRNTPCNGQETTGIPQQTYEFLNGQLVLPPPPNSYTGEPVCVCNGDKAGITCTTSTCPLGCSEHSTCVNGRCQEVLGNQILCGGSNQYIGCACQFPQLQECATANTTSVCSSSGSCDMSYDNSGNIDLGCDCNAGFLGTYCENRPCGAENCNPPFGTCIINGNGQSGTCQCLTQGTELFSGPECTDDVSSACGQVSITGNELFLCNFQGTCTKSNITNLYSCQCNPGWSGTTCGTSPCPTPCNHGRCVTSQGPSFCQCALGWSQQPTNNPCAVSSSCSGPAGPMTDVFSGSVPQCLCFNRTLAYPGCTTLACPNDANGIPCGAVNPLAGAGLTNTCNNGICSCHWSSVYDNVTGLCDPRCSAAQNSGGQFTQTLSVDSSVIPPPLHFVSCTCVSGFYAPSGCYQPVCLNGGAFVPLTGGCACRPGFSGTRCTETVCSGHGIMNVTTASCNCFSPFIGLQCQLNLCTNGGFPDPTISGDIAPNQRCNCPVAWGGTLCSASNCGLFGSPNSDGSSCTCSTPVFGGTLCNVAQCSPLGGVFDPPRSRCNCSLQYYGPVCSVRICGPVGMFVPQTSPNCTCSSPVITNDPLTGNCTRPLCGPLGTLTNDMMSCNCLANHTTFISPLSPGHSIVCQPICLNGGSYDDSIQGCNCMAGFGGLFCDVLLLSSSTGSAAASSSSSSSTALAHFSSSSTGHAHNNSSSSSSTAHHISIGNFNFTPIALKSINDTVVPTETTTGRVVALVYTIVSSTTGIGVGIVLVLSSLFALF